MMFDIAAGIVIGAFVVAAVIYGGRQMESGRVRDRGALIGGMLIAAFLIFWRGSCWYWGFACAPEHQAAAAWNCPDRGQVGFMECVNAKYGLTEPKGQ